jgi:hypothetical protein
MLQTLQRDAKSSHDWRTRAALRNVPCFKRSNAMRCLPTSMQGPMPSTRRRLQTLQRDEMSSHLLQAASASCFPYAFRLREVSLEGILLHLSKKGSCVCSSSRVRSSRREAVLPPTTAGLLDHFVMAFVYANALRRRSLPLPGCSLITRGHTYISNLSVSTFCAPTTGIT